MKATISINPATGEKLGESPLHTIGDLTVMLKEARAAQSAWQQLSVRQRAQKINPIRDYLVAEMDSLSATIASENGKLKFEALATEILPAIAAINYYCKKAPQFLKNRRISPSTIAFANYRSQLRYEPLGVVGIISPWNYPFAIAFSEVICALLGGNGVILKTATETQLSGLAVARVIEAADLPRGLFHFINIPGRIAGDAFLKNGIDKLFFTGSVEIGKYLMKKASETLTPVSLELGGNDAMIVCEDADLDLAVGGVIWGGLSNAGQSCGGIERIYVHEQIYDNFLTQLRARISTLRMGEWHDPDADIGVMTTTKQVNSVRQQVDDALDKGARILAQAPNGPTHLKNVYEPTVLIDVTHEMAIMQHETFGPVVGVIKFKTIEEAIELANDSYLGLTGSVWSRNLKKAEKIAARIKAGAVTINDHLMSHGLAETAWGGFKQSGIGRTHGKLGLLEMVEPQHIITDLLPGIKRKIYWHPYSEQLFRRFGGVIHLLYGKKFSRRIKGLFQTLALVPRIFSK